MNMMSDNALKLLMPFNTAYLNELRFTIMMSIKNKNGTRVTFAVHVKDRFIENHFKEINPY